METLIDVEPIHCHQRLDRNTLVRGLRIISDDGTECETLGKFDHRTLDFFFDHEIDHLPGMLEVCGMRQAALALAHLAHGVPMDYVVSMEWLDIRFLNYGDLDTETRILSQLNSRSEMGGRIELVLEGVMLQGDVPLVEMKGNLIAVRPDIAARLRHRKASSSYALPSWVTKAVKRVECD